MDRIVQLAQRLGAAIAEHERCKAFRAARERFENDESTRKLQQDYDAAATALRAKMERNEPLEPEEKRREAELRAQVTASETLRELLRAQADFAELMRKVNEAIEAEVGV